MIVSNNGSVAVDDVAVNVFVGHSLMSPSYLFEQINAIARSRVALLRKVLPALTMRSDHPTSP